MKTFLALLLLSAVACSSNKEDDPGKGSGNPLAAYECGSFDFATHTEDGCVAAYGKAFAGSMSMAGVECSMEDVRCSCLLVQPGNNGCNLSVVYQDPAATEETLTAICAGEKSACANSGTTTPFYFDGPPM
jgi:hypothetical protein